MDNTVKRAAIWSLSVAWRNGDDLKKWKTVIIPRGSGVRNMWGEAEENITLLLDHYPASVGKDGRLIHGFASNRAEPW